MSFSNEERLAAKEVSFPGAGFSHPAGTPSLGMVTLGPVREFATGAKRDSDVGKFDYEGFYNPLVVERFGEYMNKHRAMADGSLRDSDNWQLGMTKQVYMKSGWRHFFDWWKAHRGYTARESIEEALCALIFNAQGYLFEVLKAKAMEGKTSI